jgi:hypothetical protein
MEWLSKDASIGPTELRKKLEEKYKIKMSNWVVRKWKRNGSKKAPRQLGC